MYKTIGINDNLTDNNELNKTEVVKIDYDQNIVSYSKLLNVFWQIQDNDILYRKNYHADPKHKSIIFFTNQKQRALAILSKQDFLDNKATQKINFNRDYTC